MNKLKMNAAGRTYVVPAMRMISLEEDEGILKSSFIEVGGENTQPFDTQKKHEESLWEDQEGIWK